MPCHDASASVKERFSRDGQGEGVSPNVFRTTEQGRGVPGKDFRVKGRGRGVSQKDFRKTDGEGGVGGNRKQGLKWAVGLTTVGSRRKELLPRTLASLARAGFDRPRLFVDGSKDIVGWEREFGLEVTVRSTNVNTVCNWVLTAWELYLRDPFADRYAIFQDDLVACTDLRRYLEVMPYPEGGYCNLYSMPSNEQAFRGEVGWVPASQKGRGAVALVFSREALCAVLTARHMVDKVRSARKPNRSVDGAIVDSMAKAGWREYVHNPGLVQHTGKHSSMGNSAHLDSTTFRGEGYSAMSLLGGVGAEISAQ